MRFKYEIQISKLRNCPPAEYKRQQLLAFRFISDDVNHKGNYLPALLKSPRRGFPNDRLTCQAYGLSLFDSLENARIKYRQLEKNMQNIDKNIGTHIAEGVIKENDGVVSEINRQGHFTLHEFEHVDLKEVFSLIAAVYDGKN